MADKSVSEKTKSKDSLTNLESEKEQEISDIFPMMDEALKIMRNRRVLRTGPDLRLEKMILNLFKTEDEQE